MDQTPQIPSPTNKYTRREFLFLLAGGAAGAALAASQNPDQVFAQTPAPTQEVTPNEKPKLMQFEGEFKRFDEENLDARKLLKDISMFIDSPEFASEFMIGSMIGLDSINLEINVDGKLYKINITRDITSTTNRVYTIFIKDPSLRNISDKVEAKKLIDSLVKSNSISIEKFEAKQIAEAVFTFTQVDLNNLNAMGGNNFPGFDLNGHANVNAYLKYTSRGISSVGAIPTHEVQLYVKVGDNADFMIAGIFDAALGGTKYYIIGRPFQQDEAGNLIGLDQYKPVDSKNNSDLEDYLFGIEKLALIKVKKKAEDLNGLIREG